MASATVSLKNQGSAPVQISGMSVTGPSFSLGGETSLPITLAAGDSYSLSVQFAPTTPGAASGLLTLTSNSSTNGTASIDLSGIGGAVPPALSALSCSSASITGSGTDLCTVTLNTAAASGGLRVSLSSNDAAVAVPSTVTVEANATSAGFTALVSPVAIAQTVTVTASAGSMSESFILELSAATSTLSMNATSIAFGNVTVNSPSTQSVTLTSTGSLPVTVGAVKVTGTGFVLTGTNIPVTLSTGQMLTVNVEFDPPAAGAATGQLAITSTSSTNGTAAIALTGTGTTTSYAVALSWDAPESSADPVAGYNIYRSASGSSKYELLNSSVDTETKYMDSKIQDGLTYDYIIESVDDSGIESVPSSPISVTIP